MTSLSVEALPESKNVREAAMNPSAVTEAKVYHGRVHYFHFKDIDLPNTTLVEVGKWSSEGEESSREDFICTYYAAKLLGYESEWLPYDETGERKLFIVAGINKKSEIESFTDVQAEKIANAINQVYTLAKNLQSNLKI
jgi:hypothetical protein